jgi:hypothetical protein
MKITRALIMKLGLERLSSCGLTSGGIHFESGPIPEEASYFSIVRDWNGRNYFDAAILLKDKNGESLGSWEAGDSFESLRRC